MKLLSGILLFFVLESFFVLKGLEFVDYLAYFCEYIVNASHTFYVIVFVAVVVPIESGEVWLL